METSCPRLRGLFGVGARRAVPLRVADDLKLYEREVRFYEQLVPQMELRTPNCYYSAIDLETGHSVLLLEDLTGGRKIDKFADTGR
ncbi:MAG: ecdysteroid 22-kinase family protein [Candidatus Tectomicrobia bacterium]|nr:ecdysteroid 22-kinase family protein [Candidatus Tectomicrobia bacterium]